MFSGGLSLPSNEPREENAWINWMKSHAGTDTSGNIQARDDNKNEQDEIMHEWMNETHVNVCRHEENRNQIKNCNNVQMCPMS